MSNDNCGGCKCPISGTRHASSVYGSGGIWLCGSCHAWEENEIERTGTNALPHLLQAYRRAA